MMSEPRGMPAQPIPNFNVEIRIRKFKHKFPQQIFQDFLLTKSTTSDSDSSQEDGMLC